MPQLKLILSSFMLTMGVLLLTVSPVLAQAPVPTPSPASGTSVVTELTNASQSFGVISVLLFIIMMGLIGLVLLGAKYVLLPLITANTTQNQLLANTQALSTQALLDGAKSQRTIAETNERSLALMASLETHQQADTSRSEVLTDIKEHIDTSLKPIYQKLDEVVKSLEELRASLATQPVAKEIVNPMTEKLDDVLRQLQALQKASSEPASATPPSTHIANVATETDPSKVIGTVVVIPTDAPAPDPPKTD
jgi:predicted DNA-binding protein YlxM (UPF0122 family)